MKYETFFDDFLREIPEFRPVYDEHIRDNDELLPHVLMGNVTRFVQSAFSGIREHIPPVEASDDAVRRIVHLLGRALEAQNPALHDLVGASFIENLDFEAPWIAQLIALFGPRLAKEFDVTFR